MRKVFQFDKRDVLLVLISLILFVLFFFIALYPRFLMLAEKKKEEKVLQYQRQTLKSNGLDKSNVPSRYVKKEELLADMLQIAKDNGLMIKEMHLLENETNSLLTHHQISLVAVCDFTHFLSFIVEVNRIDSHLSMLVNKMSFHVEKQAQLVISANLVAYSGDMQEKWHLLFKEDMHNPFVSLDQLNEFTLSDTVQNTQSLDEDLVISQLRYVGYLQQGNQIKALLKSINNRVRVVHEGIKFGKEHVNVVSVTEQEVILSKKNQLIHIVLQKV